jgi:peptidoglycan/xylan/chitin deacetylase (PgdA/CDA1 family)
MRAVGTAAAVAKRASVLADRMRPRTDGLVILIYHRVGGRSPVSVDLPTPLFAEQMAYLAEHCEVVTLDEAADRLSTSSRSDDDGTGTKQPVVITFDDGTADFVEEALPVLAEHHLPATYYLATDHIERGAPFPDDGTPMTWAAVREAVASGLVEIGSHTHTHALLSRTTSTEAADELDRSIELISERAGVLPRHFAYPKALLGSPAAEIEVRRRFRTATIARTRPNVCGRADLHRLTRSPVQVSDGMRYFTLKAAGGLGLENDLRDLVNKWRYRGATH